jgi:hypothetical protein
MTEQEKFLEWVDNTISTYEDAPVEVKHGAISISITMLKELRGIIEGQEKEIERLENHIELIERNGY